MKKKSLVLLLALMLSVTACGEEPEVTGSNDSAKLESQVENDADDETETGKDTLAEDAVVSVAEKFIYAEKEGEITLTGYEAEATVLEIPESIGGVPVVAIEEYAFSQNQNIVEVVIPDSVKVVGAGAFEGCNNLVKVTFGANVEEIASRAFWRTSLESVELPEKLTVINAYSFANTKITEIEIPANVETIVGTAFAGADLETIVIPGTVKTIGEQAFEGCNNLKTVVIEEGVETIEDSAFGDCEALTSITLPSSLTAETNIDAFWGSGSVENKLTIYVPADCVLKDAILEQYNDGYDWCGAEVIE